MAEQEACTELVKQASQDQSSQSIDGESLLLPLLQGLLDAPENEQTHDSGTESGEDQRSGLIAEVQNALDKLSTSLRNDATDITAERRSSLLQLVTKLQAGLSSATSDRRHSGQLRFNRRRERPDRHTIGVSNEELADARKLMQEISCPSQSSSKTSLIPKQNSEGSVNQNAASYNPVYQKCSVKNSTPKPFSCSNSATASTNSSSVQTPSESMDCIGYLFNEEPREYPRPEPSPVYTNQQVECQSSQDVSQEYYHPQEDDEFHQVNTNKPMNHFGDSEEDDSSTVKTDNYPKPDIVMQSNPIYYQPNREDEFDTKKNRFTTRKLKMRRANTIDIPKPLHFYECDDEDETDAEEEERRRRSNYLALRGPIRVGNTANRNSMPTLEPKTENDKKFLAFISKHNQKNQRHSLWASKADTGSIWNNKFDHIKTNFEKRTDEESVSPSSARNFWKASDDSMRYRSNKYDPKISKQSAMNLKKMFEEKQRQTDEQRRNSITADNPAPSIEKERNVRFVPQPLPVNKFSHAPSSAFQPVGRHTNDNNERPQQNRFSGSSTTFRPIVEKPDQQNRNIDNTEITKSVLQVNDNQGSNRLFLYSPKPLHRESVSPTSPGFVKPWVGNTGESRVLALAAKKFENPAPQSSNSFQPRRLSKEKINTMPNFQHTNEKMTAPYLVKSLEKSSNTVRKLSGQYDNLGYQPNKFEKYPQQPTIPTNKKHIEGFQARFTVPQNYSIKYDRPKIPPQNVPIQKFVHNPTPAEVKKYNQIHHGEKHDRSQHVTNRDDYNYRKVQQPFHKQEYPKEAHHRPSGLANHYDGRKETGDHRNIQKNLDLSEDEEIHHQTDYSYRHQKPKYEAQSKVKNEVYENPKFEAQALVRTEVYDQPRIEVSHHDNETSRPSYVSQTSVESLKEYGAISSRVMSGPVAQVASTVKQKSPMTRNEHDMQAAFALKTALQKVSNSPSPNPQPKGDDQSETCRRISNEENEETLRKSNVAHNNIRPSDYPTRLEDKPRVPLAESYEMTSRRISSEKNDEPPRRTNVIHNNIRPSDYPARSEDKPRVPRVPLAESHEVTARGEHIVTGKLPLPASVKPSFNKPTQAQVLSKSDSWHQICLLNQAPPQHKPAARSAPNARNIMKSKSTHSMIVPKQYEAGMSRDEVMEKRRTMEAFFGGGSSPQQQSKSPSPGKVVKRAINRTKTSEKNVQYKQLQPLEMPTGLARSRTLPDIVCLDLLDENNVDQAFEDLFTSS